MSKQQKLMDELKPKKSLKTRRNQKLIKAMNEVAEDPDVTPKTEEEKGTKGSTASIDQNVVYNLMKKSQSNSNSAKRSSDNNDKLSSLSDLRNNSLIEGRSPTEKAKTEKSLSNNSNFTNKMNDNKKNSLLKFPLPSGSIRKDSEDTLKTDKQDELRKFSAINAQIQRAQRSKSFSKP